jgi:hypothetical protein
MKADMGMRAALALAVVALLGVAGTAGWMMATGGKSRGKAYAPESGESAATIVTAAMPGSKPGPLDHLLDQNPVEYYRKGTTAQERMDAISEFMALGDDNNYAMLRAALDDPDPEVRMYAVESATALEEEQAVEVFKKGAVSSDPDAREMTWSLCATYPIEGRAAIYRDALAFGPPEAMEEALTEMEVSPERPLFEMMLMSGNVLPGDRVPRILRALQEWLEPGGGEVPQFQSLDQAVKWWEREHENYDEFMLRVDQ